MDLSNNLQGQPHTISQCVAASLLSSSAPMNANHYFQKLTKLIAQLDLQTFDRAVELIRNAWQANHQIICFGNGGSALTAQHFITDWNKSIFVASGKPFRGRCLADNIGMISAYANDLSYQDIFVEQLKYLLEPHDLVIGISGSGNSENVLKAIAYANQQGNPTLGLCGYDGGKLKRLAQYSVWVPVPDMQLAEDIHFSFGHLVMQSLCIK